MARNVTRKPRKSLNQMSFLDIGTPARGVRIRVTAERRAFLPVPGPDEVLVRHIEMGPEDFQTALDLSDAESKDCNEADEIAVVDGIAADLAGDGWVPNGDPLIFHRRGGLIEGIKTAQAGVRAGRVVRMLVVVGVELEARFSTDDTLKSSQGRRSPDAFREIAPLPAPPTDLAQLLGGDRTVLGRAFGLRDRVAAELGYPVLPHLTVEQMAVGSAFADRAEARGIPRHVALLARACLVEACPSAADGLMATWPARGTGPADEMETLATFAVGAELFADGLSDDPYATRAASRRTRRQLLQVLFGYKGRLPDRLVSCRLRRIETDEIREMLALGGRPFESWGADELARIEPLVRDVRRNKGLVLTGQTVKLTQGGIPVDGFDRLAACLLAGRPATTFVSSGFREGFDHLRPRGRKQNIGHRLYADGYAYTWDIQSVLGNVFRITMDDRDARFTNTTLRHMHHQHSQVQKVVTFVHTLKPLVNISAIGAAILLLSRYSRELADAFSTELISVWKGETPVTETRHGVLAALIERLKRIKADGGDNDETICIILQAIDAWCDERPLGRFRRLPETGFYRLKMPPQVKRDQDEARSIRAARLAEDAILP